MRVRLTLVGAIAFPLSLYACGLDTGTVIATTPASDGGGVSGDGALVDGGAGGGDSGGGGDAGSGTDSGAGSDAGTDAGAGEKLVYACTETDIWSYDVVGNVLTKIAPIECAGSHPADLAIDAAGQAYVLEANDAVYKISLTDGTCSARNVLDSLTGDDLHISARAAGTPSFLAVDPQNRSLFGLDPLAASNAHVTTIQSDYFADDVPYDVICSAAGGCWTALAHNNCSSGSGSACIYAFPADASSSPSSRGAVGMLPAGLAFANGSLWAFGEDGRIYRIDTSGPPTATETTPARIIGAAAEPSQWFGAGSNPND